MIAKAFLFIFLLRLAACSSVPQKPAQPEEQPKAQETQQPKADSSKSLPVGSRKYKIVEAAKNEWIYFGQQNVVIDKDEESIAHVGIWEDDDYSHSDRINQYCRGATCLVVS